ncbi:redoxin domain-containing protein [Lutibacter sp. A80]|uniref:TlpA family protein disulfide reductase n=1 Tax=Lutibacter sp. A80 TaxID=2918453 RepID=UPI001F05F0F6|nr:thioredoxin-like domain-containing protein [Lutibacter sp. A80]UMB59391.1 redoxin domain-containing protein [Lutibacter sp. A80]
MLKKIVLILLFISAAAQSQTFIKGTMSPVISDLEYVILYQLKGSKQLYVANVDIDNGEFTIDFPENSPKGVYRLMYDMNNGGYVDFLYSKESVELKFNPSYPFGTTEFITSEENKLYENYKSKTDNLKQQLDSLQLVYFRLQDESALKLTSENYNKTLKNYKETQADFINKSKNKLAYNFIKASERYYAPEVFSSPQLYLNSEKLHYFDAVDFNDIVLQNSIFYTEKIVDYVFYLNRSDEIDVQNKLYINAVNEISEKIGDNTALKSEMLITLMYNFSQLENITLIDYIVENLYNKLPVENQNQADIDQILESVKLAVGRPAPDFTWDEKGIQKSLYNENEASTYMLIFWSTTCSHCLNEVPQLYDLLKDDEDVKVIAIALENDELGFNHYSEKFEKWTNVLGLNKWENPIGNAYDITSTPSYFILDANKKIISKPYALSDVQNYFKKD